MRYPLWLRLVLIAAFAAASLRAIVPVGHMIGHDPETGGIAITICTAAGENLALFNLETGEIFEMDGAPAPVPAPDDPGPCPFAAFSALFALSRQALDLDVFVGFSNTVSWQALSSAHASQPISAPPPARGPPLHA